MLLITIEFKSWIGTHNYEVLDGLVDATDAMPTSSSENIFNVLDELAIQSEDEIDLNLIEGLVQM